MSFSVLSHCNMILQYRVADNLSKQFVSLCKTACVDIFQLQNSLVNCLLRLTWIYVGKTLLQLIFKKST